MSYSLSEYTKIDVVWGFFPDPTGGREGREKGRIGKTGERGSWGNSALVVGG